jgi:hypothetical protein
MRWLGSGWGLGSVFIHRFVFSSLYFCCGGSTGGVYAVENPAPASPQVVLGRGGFVVALTAATVVAPLAVYLNKHPEIFWARVEYTFLFAGKDGNGAVASAFGKFCVATCSCSMLLEIRTVRHRLAWRRMSRQRDCGVVGLGSAYALRNIWQPGYLSAGGLALGHADGGVLSLDFEAPQSLRANGAPPAAYSLATIPLGVLARAWGLAAQPSSAHIPLSSASALLAHAGHGDFSQSTAPTLCGRPPGFCCLWDP